MRCCRVYSQMKRAPETWTLRDRIMPNCGISTQTSSSWRSSHGIPSLSFLKNERHVIWVLISGTHCWAVKERELKVWSSSTAREGTTYSCTLKTSQVRHKPPRLGGLSISEATRISPPRCCFGSAWKSRKLLHFSFLIYKAHKLEVQVRTLPIGFKFLCCAWKCEDSLLVQQLDYSQKMQSSNHTMINPLILVAHVYIHWPFWFYFYFYILFLYFTYINDLYCHGYS